jgi:cysteine-rich repeat protein
MAIVVCNALGASGAAQAAQSLPAQPDQVYLQIGELFVGTAASPGAQYVVLRQQAETQAELVGGAGYALQAFGASDANTPLNGAVLDHNVRLAQRGAPILVATPAAAAFFGVLPDVWWLGTPLPMRGMLCVMRPDGSSDDCLRYGDGEADVAQAQLDPNVANVALNPWGGVPSGAVAQRIGSTSDSARDFWLRHAPWPQNSAGQLGAAPAATCGDGAIAGLEACDAGPACGVAGGACSSVCQVVPTATGARCGNGIVEPGEGCDDGNTSDLDGCSSLCQWEYAARTVAPVCGNGRLEIGESCDAGQANGNGIVPCSRACTSVSNALNAPFACGNGAVESPVSVFGLGSQAEQCDDGDANGTAASACTIDCRWRAGARPSAACGNGVVEPGEECDDGNAHSGDGCSAGCLLEVDTVFVCGDGVLSPGETCDHGARNGTVGDACTAACRLAAPPPAALAVVLAPPAQPPTVSLGGSGPATAAVRGAGCQSSPDAGIGGGMAALGLAWLQRLRTARRRRHDDAQ